jgi:NAD(P)-dependent dehydrogenase (short-subunit alcohol dehydrogenase family)
MVESNGFDLTGRGALITGAASGIGLATARRLRSEGANVALVDIDADAGQQAADEIGGTFIRADVSNSASVSEAFATAIEALGRLDVVHLNAGVLSRESDFARLADDEYRRVVGVNIDGVVFGIREAVRAMQDTGGHILVSGSLSSVHPWPVDPLYTLTKHAVVGLVRAYAPKLLAYDILLNCICPAFVDTAMAGGLPDEQKALLLRPEAVGKAVVNILRSGKSGEAWRVGETGEVRPFQFRKFPLALFVGRQPEGEAASSTPPGVE